MDHQQNYKPSICLPYGRCLVLFLNMFWCHFKLKYRHRPQKKKKRSHPHTITQMLVGSDKPSSFLCCCCCCLVLLSIRKSFTLSAWLAWGGSSWEADVTATGLGLMSIYNERSGHANGWMLVEMTMAFFCPSSPPAALVNELKNVGINFVKKKS